MKRSRAKLLRHRRGAIAVLAALMLVLLLGMIAFAIDVGYISMVSTQLQAAADSAALAAAGASSQSTSAIQQVAQTFAGYHSVAGRLVQLSASDVQLGTWDSTSCTFSPVTGSAAGTAVKVTVRTDDSNGGATPLFFSRIFGMVSLNQQASAVAAFNPRDIAFVIDLSGSMNDDTSPSSSTSSASLMQTVYNQFGFGTYPGTTQTFGQTIGTTSLSNLESTTGPLSKSTIPTQYRILSTDSSSTRTKKAYSWTMDVQLATLMPNAIPTPNSTNSQSYSYWSSYFSYAQSNWSSKLGYQPYLDFMMHYGRDVKPDGSNYTPLSLNSNLCACPMHSELVGTTSFSFPPDEMPTHAARSAIIAAIQVVQTQNQNISDTNQNGLGVHRHF